MLQITTAPIGQGKERACYVHPDDPSRAIKIPLGDQRTQTRREVEFYENLRRQDPRAPLPRYYGQVETNLGRGIVVDLVRDYDGSVSRPLNRLLAEGRPIEEFEPCLDAFGRALLEHLVIFNHDMNIGNLLLQRLSPDESRLVAIDGLGDTVAIGWLNRFPWLVRRKIERRWARFIARLYRAREIRAQRAAAARDEPG